MKSTLIKAAVESGNLLMQNFNKIKKINAKTKTSLVTNVDFESDKLIKKIIQSKFPEHNIISEESDKIDNKSGYTWHIDPVDGTHNYLRGLPLFGVSAALEHKGEIIMGAINMPYFKRLYFAEKGKGAFCNDKIHENRRFSGHKKSQGFFSELNVSKTDNLDFSIVVTDFGHGIRDKTIDFIRKMSTNVVDIRNFGCAVYGLAEVAEGNVDAYVIYKTNSWDVAAGFLLIEEADGKVTSHKGEKWDLNDKSFLASNGKIHNSIIQFL